MGGMARMGDFLKRLMLSLSAYEFQRGYWFGGVLVLASLLVTNAANPLGTSWIVSLFANRWVVYLAFGAVLAPPLLTIVSEVTFWSIRAYGPRQYQPLGRFIATTVERTKTTQRSEGRSTEQISKRDRYLVPAHFRSGGVKQIVSCFVSKSFKSHFFGYSPYSVWIGTEDPVRKLTRSVRGIVLAKEEETLDFELIHEAFSLVRVCHGCWILCRNAPQDRGREESEAP